MTDTQTVATYRAIEPGHGACQTCNEVHPLTNRHNQPAAVNRHGVRHKRWLLPVHGPRNNRCAGSHTEPKAWLDAAGLPSWDHLTDLDRGAALMFVWKVRQEGEYAYARDNYPARYRDHPLLAALDAREACRHASAVAGSWAEAIDRLGEAEVERLYDLALNYEREQRSASGV
ncbi:hypothetical protein GCM10011608_11060 [Micromonospora sonchi]|uniref:Uncharacterized protein n=1 Tax=Micromonospora sonchi TaxID=1763543 RepID=A0A917WSL4_9ACTN|nr:hypothetical protein [Micromonospora sonchi]GGM27995.1 hypothetical protein GCM10011608_11060 [Micromonospora sonchi]